MKRIPPKPGQESVWDYPRPPRMEKETKSLKVIVNDVVVASTNRGYRILETSHPPVYYLPVEAINMEFLEKANGGQSYCEFKGKAIYWDLKMADVVIPRVAWSYPSPNVVYQAIKDHLAFYPSKVSACFVGDEKVLAQEGDFYGGWITSNIVGPFKGAPGTWGW